MAELNKEQLKKELVEIYEGYLKNNNDNIIKQRAQKLFLEYTTMANALPRELMDAIWGLEHIGYDYGRGSQKGIWKLNSKDAEIILKDMK